MAKEIKPLKKLNAKVKTFADEYIICLNAAEAARRAGYAEKTARIRGAQLLNDPLVSEYIQQRMASKEEKLIATQDDILKFLTDVMNGNIKEQIPLLDGDGYQKLAELDAAQPKDRIKAAELLGKRYKMWTDKQEIDQDISINVTVDYGDDPE